MIASHLTRLVSRLLETGEREAVTGDLAESGITGFGGLREVAGLVLRRQVEVWNGWEPWVALLGIGLPIGALLAYLAAGIGFVLNLRLETWLPYGLYHRSPLPWPEQAIVIGVHGCTVVLWAWAAAAALVLLARRTIVLTSAVVALVWLAPLALMVCNLFQIRWYPIAMAKLMLQFLVHVVLLLLPAIAGLRFGAADRPMSRRHARTLALITVVLAALSTWTGGWPAAGAGWQWRLMVSSLTSWPAFYVATRALRRERRA